MGGGGGIGGSGGGGGGGGGKEGGVSGESGEGVGVREVGRVGCCWEIAWWGGFGELVIYGGGRGRGKEWRKQGTEKKHIPVTK